MSVGWVYLLETKPYDPVAATTKNLFFASNLADDADLGQSTPYQLRLKQAFSHETAVFDQNIPGGTQISVGSSTINNADGALDYLLSYSWDGRDVTVKRGRRGQPYATYTTEFVGSTLELTADGTDLVLAIRDNSWKLANPIQTNTYVGSGGKEGKIDLKLKKKPLLFGPARNLTPIPVDVPLLTYQLHDGALTSVSKVYDRGVPLTYASNFATYASLAGSVIAPGTYATCLAEGFVRLGAKPVGAVTVDATGAYGSATNIPELARQILLGKAGLAAGQLNTASFTQMSLDAAYSYEGVYVPEPDFQIDELLETLVSAVNGFWYLNKAGLLCVRQFKFTAPAATVRMEDLASLQRVSSPAELYRVRTNYGKNLTVQASSDFVLPSQTLNGYLKDNKLYVATAADGTGGSYSGYVGELTVFLNRTKVNSLPNIIFANKNNVPWLTMAADGTFTVTDPGTDVASAVLTASLGEFSLEETFTLAKSKGANPKNLLVDTNLDRFYFNQSNAAEPSGQTATITAVPTNLTLPLSFSAVDNLGNAVSLSGSGNTRTIPISALGGSILVAWVLVTATSPDGTSNSVRILVSHGDDTFSTGLLSALAASDGAIDIFYQNSPPSSAQIDDLWFDLDDGNKLYRYTSGGWVESTDTRLADALNAATTADAKADGKVTTFFSETAPVATALGDLWFRPSTKTLYRWDGSSWGNSVSTIGAQAGNNLTDSTGAVLGDADVKNVFNQTPAQNTTSIFGNQNFDIADPNGRPLGLRAGISGGALNDTLLGWSGGVGGDLMIAGTGSIRVFFPMWRAKVRSRYRVRMEVREATAGTSGFTLRFVELDTEPSSSVLHMVASVTPDGTCVTATREVTAGGTALTGAASVENADLTTSFQTVNIQNSPYETAKFIGLEIIRAAGSPSLIVKNCVIEEIAPTTLGDMDPAAQAVLDANFDSGGAIKTNRVTLASLATNFTGIEIVTVLPTAGNFEGRTVVMGGKLYRYTGSAFTAAVPTADLTGTVSNTQIAAGAVDVAKFAAGIAPVEIVSTLPTAGNFTGRTVMLTSDGKIYRYTGGAFTAAVPTVDLTGTVSSSQIAGGAIDTTKFATNVRPVETVAALPAAGLSGRIVYLTTDNKLYRDTGSAWTAAVPAVDISGTIAGTQIADNAVTNQKISDAALSASKFATGVVPIEVLATLPVTGNFQGRTVMLTSDNKLYRYTGSAFTAAVPTVDLTGSISAAQLATGVFGESLVLNPGAESGDTSGWGLTEGTLYTFAASTADRQSGSYSFAIIKTATSQSSGVGHKAVGVVPGRSYTVRVSVKGSAATASGLYVRVNYCSAAPAGGIVTTALRTGYSDASAPNGAVPSAWTSYEYSWVAPAGANWATVNVVNGANGPLTVYFDDVQFYEQVVASDLASGAVTAAKFATGLTPVEILAALPVTGNFQGRTVALTTDNKLYRYDGAAFTAAVPTSDLSGTVQGSQIASAAIDATKFASAVKPVEVLAALPAFGTAGRMVFLTTDKKLYRDTGTAWTSAVPTTDLTGTVVSGQIADGAVIAAKIANAAIDTTKFASGIAPVEILGVLPTTGNFQGRTVMLTSDNKLYRYTGSAFTAAVPAGDLTGQVVGTQIADNAVTAAKIASGVVDATKFASGIAPVEILGALPSSGNYAGRTVFLTTDNKLYRYTGSAFTAAVPTADLTGTISSAQLAAGAVDISKFGSGVKPIEVLGALPAAGTAGRVVFLTTDSKLYRDTGSAWTATVPTADLSGTVVSGQIADNAVTAAKIASGVVDATKFASGIAPVEILGALPSSGNFTGRTVMLTTDGKLYRYASGAFTAAVPTTDLTGTISGSQIAGAALDATKFASAVKPVEVLGSLPTAGTPGRMVFLTSDNKLYRDTGSAWTSATAAADVTGQVVSTQIADNAVTAAKIASGIIDTTKFASGIEPVEILGTLPSSGNFQGRIVLLTTDNKLYRYTGSVWTAAVPTTDLTGTIASAQIAANAVDITKFATGVKPVEVLGALPASGTAGRVVFLTTDNKLYRDTGSAWTAAVPTTDLSGTISSSQIAAASIDISKFAGGVKPVEVLSSLPASGTAGRVVFLTTDSKLYRDTGSAWTAAVPTTDLTGTIASAQIADGSVVAAKIADASLTTAKLAAGLAAVEIVGSLPASGNFAGRTVFLTTDGKLYRYASGAFTSAVPSTDISGTFSSGQLADGSITTAKFATGLTPVEKVGALPNAGNFEGRMIFLTTDDKIYRWTDTTTTGTSFWSRASDGADIAAGSITTGKFVAGAISTNDLAANAVTAAKIAANTITAAQIAANTITAGQILAGAISTTELAANAVTAAKIAANTITSNEIAANTITAGQIAANTITASQIAADTITAGQIAANAVTASELAANSVVAGKISAGTIVAADIAANTITAAKIAANTITAAQIAAGTITATELAANSIVAGKIAAGTVTATELAANTVTAAKIAANTITSAQILAGTITATELAANTVTAAKIAANTITSAQIAANTITAGQIQAGAISATEIAANAITATKLYIGEQSNYILDPVFSDLAYWTISPTSTINTTDTQVTTVLASRVALKSATGNGTTSQATETTQLSSAALAYPTVEPGMAYRVQADWVLTAGFTGQVQISVDWFTRDGTTAAATATNTQSSGDYRTTALAAQQLSGVDGIFTAPANSAYARFRIQVLRSTTLSNAGTAYVTRPKFQRASGSELIVDGAITTNKLIANAVTAAKIAANTITAAQIAAGTITATELAAGSITAGKIAAGVISTTELAANAVTAAKIAANTITAAQIAAGTITATQIAANTITAGQIAANAITAAQIQAGAISATEIAANAITASKLYIGEQSNYILDPVFSDLAYWTISPTSTINATDTIVTTTLGARVALKSAAGNGTTTQSQENTFLTSATMSYVTIEPGMPYRVQADYVLTAGFTGILQVYVYWFKRDGVTASATPFNALSSADYRTTALGSQLLSGVDGIFTAPADAVYGRYYIALTRSTTLANAGTAYVTRPKFQRASGAELIVDGAITTNKLTANAVTAAKIAANTITAGQIAADTITAGQIAANAITASELAANSVVAGKILAGTITATDIAANTITSAQIAANTITAGQVAANTITSAQIAANTITAGQIAAGAISATQIAANAIIASKLYVGETSNYVLDGLYTDSAYWLLSGWTLNSSDSQITTTLGVISGIKSVSGNGTTSQATTQAMQNVGQYMTVEGGMSYRAQLEYVVTAGFTGIVVIYVDWFNRAGTSAGTSGQILGVEYRTTAAAAQTMAGLDAIVVAPATAVTCRMQAQVVWSATQNNAGTAYAARPIFQRAMGAELVVDGAITTNKLTANAVTAAKIAANTITATQIAAGTITATELAANSITAGKIAAGAISATEIAANAITASKLSIGEQSNYILDPLFGDTAYWNVSSGSTVNSTDTIVTTTLGARVALKSAAGNGTTSQVGESTFLTSAALAYATVEPGMPYRIQADYVLTAGFTGILQIAIDWYKRDGVTAATTATNTLSSTDYRTAALGTQLLSGLDGIFTAPADAVYARYRTVLTRSTTLNNAGLAYLTRPRLQRASGGELIVDGAITTSKLVANAVTAAKIAAATITATEIAASTITGAKIAATTITAANIAASTITAGQIAAGTLTATQIAANAITASKLFVGDTSNMVPDPDFVDSASLTGDPFTLVANTVTGGSSANLISLAGPGTKTVYSSLIPVEGGKPYYFTAGLSASANATCTVAVYVIWYSDLAGATSVVGSTGGASEIIGAPSNTLAVARVSKTYPAPATARRCRIAYQRTASTADTGVARFADAVMRRAANGELIVDGTITAAKLVANTITANEIAGNTITAAQLAAGSVTASQIAAGAITTSKLTLGDFDNLLSANEWRDGTLDGWTRIVQIGGPVLLSGPAPGSGWPSAYGLVLQRTAANTTTEISITNGNYNFDTDTNMVGGWTCNPGDEFSLSVYVYSNTTGVTPTVEMLLRSSNSTLVSMGTSGLPNSSTITQQVVNFSNLTGQRGKAYFRFSNAGSGTSAANAYVQFWSPVLRRRNNANLIVDGAITTAKLTANAVTAAKIAAGTITANEIAATTITGAKIAATTITATNIAAGTITATQIASGTITAGLIAANAITANKLTLTDVSSFVLDPNFTDPAYWQFVGCTVNNSDSLVTASLNATAGIKFTGNGTTSQATGYAVLTNNNWFTVEPGATYRLRCDVAWTAGFTGVITLYVEWYTRALSAATLPAQGLNVSDFRVTAATIAAASGIEFQAAAPANAVWARVQMQVVWSTTQNNAGSVYAVRPRMQRALTSELVVDGQITTAKLAANSITAAKIAANTITATQIATDTITANEIASNAITVNELAANAVTANKILAGTITATQMAANSITASKIAIGDFNNLIPNNDFRSNTLDGWSRLLASNGNTIVAQPGANWPGSCALLLTRNEAAGSTSELSIVASPVDFGTDTAMASGIPTVIGDQFVFRATTFVTNGALPVVDMIVRTDSTTFSGVASANMPTGQFVTNSVSLTNTVGTGKAYLRLRLGGTTTASPAALYFWNVSLLKKNTGELIVDGAITAAKIAANTITAGQIAADTITAAQIAANAITASELAAGAVTAGKIQAGSVSASEIAAGAITASKLAVIAESLFADPYFEDDNYSYAYNTSGGTFSGPFPISPGFSSNNLNNGWYREAVPSICNSMLAAKYVCLNSGANGIDTNRQYHIYASISSAAWGRIEPSTTYEFSAQVRNYSNQNLLVELEIFNASLNYIATHQQAWGNGAVGSGRTQYTTPAGAYAFRVRIANSSGGLYSGEMQVGNVQVRRTLGGSLLVDGTISAAKLVAGSITADKIAGSTITGDKIAANTISASSLQADSITAAQIAAGAIGASELAANSVTAKNLLVADFTNLIPNGDFKSGNLDGWSRIIQPAGTSVVVEGPGTGWPSAYAVTLNRTAANTSAEVSVTSHNLSFGDDSNLTTGIVCNAGDQFYLNMICFVNTSGIWPNAELILRTSSGAIHVIGSQQFYPAFNNFVTCESHMVNNTGLNGKLYLRLQAIGTNSNPANAKCYFWNVVVQRKNNGNLIVDGAITASKVAASNVITSSAQIGNAVIAAANIADGNITTAKIGDGQITTAKIGSLQVTSATIQDLTVGTTKITANAVTRMGNMSGPSSSVMTTTEQYITCNFSGGEIVGYDEYGNPYYSSSTENLRVSFSNIPVDSAVTLIVSLNTERVGGSDDLFNLRCIRDQGGNQTQVGRDWGVRSRTGSAVTTYVFQDSPPGAGSYTYYFKGVRTIGGTGPNVYNVGCVGILGQR